MRSTLDPRLAADAVRAPGRVSLPLVPAGFFVVEEGKAERQEWPLERFWQWWKWPCAYDAAPCGAVERDISRRQNQLHFFDAAVRRDDELDCHPTFFQQWRTRGLRDQLIPWYR
jgi:hypothetical protein